MATSTTFNQATPSQVQEMLRQGKGLLLFEGVLCLVGGALAIIFPVIASQGLELVLGVLALMLGVMGLVRSGLAELSADISEKDRWAVES